MKTLFTILLFVLNLQINAQSPYWEQLKRVTGTIHVAAINDSGDVFFVANYCDTLNHIWKLPKNSDTPIDCFSTTDTIGKIFITKNNNILVFTGSREGYHYSVPGDYFSNDFSCKSIIISIDNGKSWIKKPIEINGNLKLEKNKNGFIYLTGVKFYEIEGSKEIYLSQDDGINFKKVNWSYGQITGLKLLKSGSLMAVSDSITVFISNDNGNNWDTLSVANKNIDYDNICENSQGYMYSPNLYISKDLGKTWNNYGYSNNDTLVKFTILPNDLMYAIGNSGNIYKSPNYGDIWIKLITEKIIDNKLYQPDIFNYNQNIFFFIPLDKDSTVALFSLDTMTNLLVGPLLKIISPYYFEKNYYFPRNGNILLIFQNHIIQQLSIDDLKLKTIFYELPCDKAVSNILLTSKNTIIIDFRNDYFHYERYISRDFGFTWHYVKDTILNDKLFQGNGEDIFSCRNNQMYISKDDFISFQKYGNSIPDSITLQDSQIEGPTGACSPNGYLYLLSYKGICLSTDMGNNWTYKSTANVSQWFGIQKIRFDKQNNIFTFSLDRYFRSTDYGDSWKQIKVFGDYHGNFDISPDNTIYVIYTSIYKSTDKGDNWVELVNNLSSNELDINNSGIIFAGNFLSTDMGNNWIYTGVSGLIAHNNENTIITTNSYGYFPIGFPSIYKFVQPSEAPSLRDNLSNNLTISPNPVTQSAKLNWFFIKTSG